MYNTFEFVGKIVPIKKSDKFKPYEEKTFDSGWVNKQFKFNMVCGCNRHMLEIQGGSWNGKNGKEDYVYTFSKATVDESGNKVKGKNIQISFADRLKQDEVNKVAEFRKFIVDLEQPNRRYNLEKAIDKFKEGTITTEQMETLDCNSIEECEKALAESQKKRKEFISPWDFAEYMNKVANSEKIKNKIFKVTGNYEITYSEKNGQFYRHFIPSRIYLADDNAEQISQASLGLFFNRNAIDDNDFANTSKYHVNAFIRQYDNSYKKDIACPITVTIDSNMDVKKAEGFKKKFTFPETDATWREIGVTVTILDGAQKVEITEDMLTDEQKENIEYGFVTIEDIAKEIGGSIYGDRVQDTVIDGLARGYSKGSQDTAYEDNDFGTPTKDTSEEDIFTDDDDLDI